MQRRTIGNFGTVGAMLLTATLLFGINQSGLAQKGKPPPTPPPTTPEKIVLHRWVKIAGINYVQAFTMNTDGTAQTQITSSKMDHQFPRWSPDLDPATPGYQGKIAFTNNTNLWVMDPDGRYETQLTTLGFTSSGTPSWSPDGRYIAFRVFGSINGCGVYVYGPFGSPTATTQYVLTAGDGFSGTTSVSWSPDLNPDAGYQGKLIVSSNTGPAGGGVYALAAVIDVAGVLTVAAEPVPMPCSLGFAVMTSTPSGGLRLAGTTTTTTGFSVVAMDASYDLGSDAFTMGPVFDLTPNGLVNELPQWSFDGTRIAHQARTANNTSTSEVYVIRVPDMLGGQVVTTRLTNNSVFDGHPSWSPAAF